MAAEQPIELIERIPIPAIHTIYTVNGCNYFRFKLGLAEFVECQECQMRTVFENNTVYFHHSYQCRHTMEMHLLNIRRASTIINLDDEIISAAPPPYSNTGMQANTQTLPPPPPYTP